MNFQNNDFNDNNITITDASTTSTTDALTLILGCNLNGSEADGFHSVVTINGYSTVTIDAIGVSHFATGGENSFVGFDLDSNPGAASNVIITGQASFDFGTSYFTEAGTGGPGLSGDNGERHCHHRDGVGLRRTRRSHHRHRYWATDLASTDAHGIDASAGGGLFMSAPDTNIGEGVTVIGSSGTVTAGSSDGFNCVTDPTTLGNLLQGSLGLLSSSAGNYGYNDGALTLAN